MRKLNSKGFTIIELLVVIVIIGILVALALPQLFAAQARGRDTERKNDLKNIKTQLETYFNDEGNYPTQATSANISTVITGTLQDRLSLTAEDLESPRPGSDQYMYQSDGNTYTITASLENKDDSASEPAGSGTYIIRSVNQDTTTAPATP